MRRRHVGAGRSAIPAARTRTSAASPCPALPSPARQRGELEPRRPRQTPRRLAARGCAVC